MPQKPLKPCCAPGCRELIRGARFCAKHEHLAVKQERKVQDQRRGSSAQRGYGYKWQQAREGFLRHNPLCAECQRHGRVTAALIVDHIKAHKGDMTLFWDRMNWQPLCKPCHDAKTAREDGGFGNQEGR